MEATTFLRNSTQKVRLSLDDLNLNLVEPINIRKQEEKKEKHKQTDSL